MNSGLFPVSGSNSNRRIIGLISNGDAVSGTNASQMASVVAAACAKQINTTTVLNTLTEVINISGKGAINWLGFASGATANFYFEIEVDGVVIRRTTSASFASGFGLIAIGAGFGNGTSGDASVVFQPIYFDSSVKIRYSCGTAGTTLFTYLNAEIHA